MALPVKTLVVDNGAYTIKAGFSDSTASYNSCVQIPNCIARGRDRRVYVGSELDSCRDFGMMTYRRPVERGFLVNWESEKEIWDRAFIDKKGVLKCDPKSTNLILTEAPNTLAALQSNCDQMIFEEYEFASYYRCVGGSLVAWNNNEALYDTSQTEEIVPAEATLVIDTGYSFTHIIPVIDGKVWNSAVRRIDVGGKVLTNYLKDIVSIRHYYMMEETHVINEVKENTSFVSLDFKGDLEKCKKEKTNDIVLDWVLPDYNTGKAGFKRPPKPKKPKVEGAAAGKKDEEDYMTLGNERFSVPELLFNPSNIGYKQAGIVETVMQSLEIMPEIYRYALLANIVIVGGNAKIPGFKERFINELRPLAPHDAEIRVGISADPTKYNWLGGVQLAQNKAALRAHVVTKEEYEEHGGIWTARKFAGLEEPKNDSKRRKVET